MTAKWCVALIGVAAFAGCGAKSGVSLGQVSGRVYFFSLPARAELLFQPVDDSDAATGRPSTAFTDQNGRYDLRFTETERGAVVGRHLVTVKVYADPNLTASLNLADQTGPIRVTRVVRHVPAGHSTLDFALNF